MNRLEKQTNEPNCMVFRRNKCKDSETLNVQVWKMKHHGNTEAKESQYSYNTLR